MFTFHFNLSFAHYFVSVNRNLSLCCFVLYHTRSDLMMHMKFSLILKIFGSIDLTGKFFYSLFKAVISQTFAGRVSKELTKYVPSIRKWIEFFWLIFSLYFAHNSEKILIFRCSTWYLASFSMTRLFNFTTFFKSHVNQVKNCLPKNTYHRRSTWQYFNKIILQFLFAI